VVVVREPRVRGVDHDLPGRDDPRQHAQGRPRKSEGIHSSNKLIRG
jgi:hypothetical protein